jgi:gamma-glutamylcyclotransferase (GGCT)/AIG2-like uncharacterized protein YtfP
MKKERIFVYGTLLEGCGNHQYYLRDAKKLGEHITDSQFTMLHLGGFPGVIGIGNTAIRGEVYEITENEFRDIDGLEGYNPNNPSYGLYDRTQIKTPWGNAWIYLYNHRDNHHFNKITSGSWRNKD